MWKLSVIFFGVQQLNLEENLVKNNQILKGSNYVIKGQSDYSGGIKPSDSDIVRAYKEINRIKFVQSNKANVSRLIKYRQSTSFWISNDQSLDIMTETKTY